MELYIVLVVILVLGEVLKLFVNSIRATRSINPEVLELKGVKSIIAVSTYYVMLPITTLLLSLSGILPVVMYNVIGIDSVSAMAVSLAIVYLLLTIIPNIAVNLHVKYMDNKIGKILEEELRAKSLEDKEHSSEEWFR